MSPHLICLGWTLIHCLWQASAIGLIYKVFDALCARSSCHVRHVLALAALLGTFVGASVTMLYEETCASTSAGAAMSSVQPAVVAEYALTRALPCIDALWTLGVLALSIRTAGGWWLVRRLRTTAIMQVPEALFVRFQRVSRRLHITRRIDLALSACVSSPLTVGFVRGLVLLPVSALTALTAEQLEVVLAHELAHVRRADYLWNFLQTIVETLFFFHPAVWWLGGRARERRELCCDEIALELCSDPVVYATALLRLEEERHAEPQLALALDGHQSGSSLRLRIAHILGEDVQSSSGNRIAAKFVALVALSGILLALLLPSSPVNAEDRSPLAEVNALDAIAQHPRPVIRWAGPPKNIRPNPRPVIRWAGPPKNIRPQPTSAQMIRNAAAVWRTVKPHPPSSLVRQRHDPPPVLHPERSKPLLDI